MEFLDIVPACRREVHWRWRVQSRSKTGTEEDTDIADFLKTLNPKEQAYWMALFERLCELGPEGIPEECHGIDDDNGIFEISKGNHRVAWFYSKAERKVIICTHGFRKKSQKTPAREKRRALKVKGDYENYIQSRQSIGTMK